ACPPISATSASHQLRNAALLLGPWVHLTDGWAGTCHCFRGGVWGLLGRAVCDRIPGSQPGAGGRRRRPSVARLAPCPGLGFRGTPVVPGREDPGRRWRAGGGCSLREGRGCGGGAPTGVQRVSAGWCARAVVGIA